MSYIGNSPGVASQRIVSSFTATAGQTLFTLSSGYSLGYLDVYLNGVKLINGTDYTADNGTTVTLTQATALNDTVECVAYLPRGLSDGYLKSEADALLANKVSKTGDVITGNLAVTRALTGAQIGGVQWNGDIDDAKWSTKLGGYYLSFLNPHTSETANLEGSTILLDGLNWRSKARMHPSGDFEIARGIKFPASQNASPDANTLDDYEEGTWTPTVTSGTIAFVNSARYTKIGRVVTVIIDMVLGGTRGGEPFFVGGLPFPNVSGGWAACPIYSASTISTYQQVLGVVRSDDTSVEFNAMGVNVLGNQIQNGYFNICATYFTN